MSIYQVGGPARRDYQKRGLNKAISTGGVVALLFEPGMGKTATTLDYAGLLAMKAADGEARVLVVAPLAAVDTWVEQAGQYLSPDLGFWAEALGGSLMERAEALASRGGNPWRKRLSTRSLGKVHPRAWHTYDALAWAARPSPEVAQRRTVPITRGEGPEAVGTPRVVLEVVNIDTLTSRRAFGRGNMADLMVDAIRRFDPELVVVDESHKIKSATGNASRLLARVAKFVRRRIILTGTVMPHSPLDVFGQWRFLDPYAFGDLDSQGNRRQATFGGFRARYAIEGGWMGKEVIGYQNLEEMQTIMARNAIVAKKNDALDLPPTTDAVIHVNLSAKEKKAYAEMRDTLAVMLDNGQLSTSDNRLVQMLRLRQITSGRLPDDQGTSLRIGTSKVDTIRSLVQDTLTGEKRIVIFAFFTDEIHEIGQALTNRRPGEPKTQVMVITGDTGHDERVAMRKRFGDTSTDERIVMIAQVKTMSLAVNELVSANHAIFASMSQQRDDYIQARDRLDRIGQTRPVTFWHVVAPGTVDEVILKTHRERGDLEAAMLKHIAGGA